MPSLTIRNITDRDYEELRRNVKQKGRSINAEILKLLGDKTEMNRRRRHAAKAMKRIDKLTDEIARKYPNQPSSVDLIREDRDSR
jgi:plasmid stability protein